MYGSTGGASTGYGTPFVGRGGVVQADFNLKKGEKIRILVGKCFFIKNDIKIFIGVNEFTSATHALLQYKMQKQYTEKQHTTVWWPCEKPA